MSSMKEFFNFSEQPFKMTPASDTFFEYESFTKATQTFHQFLSSDMPFFQMVSDNGTGKSSFIKKATSMLNSNYIYSIISYRNLKTSELLLKIADDFKIEHPSEIDEYRLLQLILNFFNTTVANGKKIILFIDDAETIPTQTLEKVLSFVDIASLKNNFKILLSGNDSFNKSIADEKLTTLTQRTFATVSLENLSLLNIRRFINFQIKASGSRKLNVSNQVMTKVAKLSKGNLRIINMLMEKSMISAYVDNSNSVNLKHLNKALITTKNIFSYHKKLLNSRSSKIYKYAFFFTLAILLVDITFSHILDNSILTRTKDIFKNEDVSKLEDKKSIPFAQNLFVNDNVGREAEVEKRSIMIDNSSGASDNSSRASDNNTTSHNIGKFAEKKSVKENINATSIAKATEEKILTIIVNSLNIRSKPTTESAVIGKVKSGDKVLLLKDEGEWINIKFNDTKGYIMKQYAKPE